MAQTAPPPGSSSQTPSESSSTGSAQQLPSLDSLSEPARAALDSYRKLVRKADDFVLDVTRRRGSRVITCRLGCEACCHVSLELNEIEATIAAAAIRSLPRETTSRLARFAGEHASLRSSEAPRCALLDEDGSCAIYDARPLVCRTQGMALRYPPRTFPQHAVMARDELGSDIVWCPLNYQPSPPRGPDILEAGRLDEMLALANRAFVGEDRQRMLQRYSLRELLLFHA